MCETLISDSHPYFNIYMAVRFYNAVSHMFRLYYIICKADFSASSLFMPAGKQHFCSFYVYINLCRIQHFHRNSFLFFQSSSSMARCFMFLLISSMHCVFGLSSLLLLCGVYFYAIFGHRVSCIL